MRHTRNTARRAALTLSALGALLGACAAEPGDDVARSGDAILNGTTWNPWTQSTNTWSRTVVRIPGCTGTLVRPNWVLSAAHCFDDTTDPSTITVRHMESDGSVTERTAVEILHHPAVLTDHVDAMLVRIDPPIDTGVAAVPIYAGDTDAMLGQSARCFGYGAVALNASCGDGLPACPSGQFCKWGRCMTDPGWSMRTGVFTVTADVGDGADTDRFFRFVVPNGLGQMTLPGDSGASCAINGSIAGIVKAGGIGSTPYNRLTSAEAWRAWVEATVDPATVSTDNSPGAGCRSTSAALTYTADGAARNNASVAVTAICRAPRRMDDGGAFSDVVSAPRVWVVDRSATADVCCRMIATHADGTVYEGPARCSAGNTSAPQSLSVAELAHGPTFSSFALRCAVPASTSSGASAVLGYRIVQSRR